MVERQLDQLFARKHPPHVLAEPGPVVGIPEVVEDGESALLQVLAEGHDVPLRHLHEAGLGHVDDGVFAQLRIADVDDPSAVDVRVHVGDRVEDLDEVGFRSRALADRDIAVGPGRQAAVVVAAGGGVELQAGEDEAPVVGRGLVNRRVDGTGPVEALRARGGREGDDERGGESRQQPATHSDLQPLCLWFPPSRLHLSGVMDSARGGPTGTINGPVLGVVSDFDMPGMRPGREKETWMNRTFVAVCSAVVLSLALVSAQARREVDA